MRGLCQRLALYLSLCLSLLLYATPAFAASVLAIDYGADYIKASLMKPGLPFDVLLNKDSKRKIHSSVAWKNGERLFGQDAYNLVRTSRAVIAVQMLTYCYYRLHGSPKTRIII